MDHAILSASFPQHHAYLGSYVGLWARDLAHKTYWHGMTFLRGKSHNPLELSGGKGPNEWIERHFCLL